MPRKSRQLPFRLGSGNLKINQYVVNGGNPNPPPPDYDLNSSLGTIFGSQTTDSENHHWPPKPGDGDVGGNFFTQKKYVVGQPMTVRAFANQVVISPTLWKDIVYTGPIWPLPPSNLQFPAAAPDSDSKLNQLGATAVSKVKPTNAVVNLTTSLVEILRDGLPRVPFKDWEAGTSRARQGADQYLNLEFGWEPLIGDINRVTEQIANAERIFSQYERDAGKVVRRRFDFPEKRETSVLSWFDTASGYYAPADTSLTRSGRKYTVTRVHSSYTKTWFSGAFVYHLPADYRPFKEMSTSLERLRAMFSLELTPESVWNAIPWTWASDWFSNAGDVMSNLSSWANDGLVMRYGYVMQHNVESYTYTLDEPRPLLGMSSGQFPSITLVTETKKRRKANPYGFGVSWDGLTATQQAILAALGIKRAR